MVDNVESVEMYHLKLYLRKYLKRKLPQSMVCLAIVSEHRNGSELS